MRRGGHCGRFVVPSTARKPTLEDDHANIQSAFNTIGGEMNRGREDAPPSACRERQRSYGGRNSKRRTQGRAFKLQSDASRLYSNEQLVRAGILRLAR